MKTKSKKILLYATGIPLVLIALYFLSMHLFVTMRLYSTYTIENSDSHAIFDKVVDFNKTLRMSIVKFDMQGSFVLPAYFEMNKKKVYLYELMDINDYIYKPAYSDSLWLIKSNGERISFLLYRL